MGFFYGWPLFTRPSGALAGLVLAAVLFCGGQAWADHRGRFNRFEGTATCLACHAERARSLHASVHYQWRGDAGEAVGLNSRRAGKLGAINDFCGYTDINWIGRLTNLDGRQVDGGCARCHVGLGDKPAASATQAQLENIDCLVCHSDQYKRQVARVDDRDRFVADPARMAVSLTEAAWNVGRPSTASCLNCHARAGGGNNFKRGDLEDNHRRPGRNFDVHLAPRSAGGAGLTCLSCHTARNHRIAGRGTDLRPRDLAARVDCANCHTASPHASSRLNNHAARIYCTVCHIPSFAQTAATDVERDWSLPGQVDQAARLYEPHMDRRRNVTPVYRFFNGRSRFYAFDRPADPPAGGRLVMSEPLGGIDQAGARIHAFKRHLGTLPADPADGRLLPQKIGVFFQTGSLVSALRQGLVELGRAYRGHRFIDTVRYMGLYHEVRPKEAALSCRACHDGGTRLDFASLGYTPRTSRSGRPLCLSCHGDESDEWSAANYFSQVHREHVDERGYNCRECHNFSAAYSVGRGGGGDD